MLFTGSIAITVDGPGNVAYGEDVWRGDRTYFAEAGTKIVNVHKLRFAGWGPQNLVVTVAAANEITTTFHYDLGCVDPVPSVPQIQPANDYVGRCGTDVQHTVSGQISSPVAQTVRYRWADQSGGPTPGVDGAERELVFTEPGTKTVSAPLQRVPMTPGIGLATAKVQIVSPGSGATAQSLAYSTACVKAEFTALTRTAGNCRTGTVYKYRLDGYVESDAIAATAYAWAWQESINADWVRDPWTPISFTLSDPGRKNVTRTWTAPGDGEGAWRLEVLGTDGTVVSQSLPYYVPCGL
ncbi:hypothetical protein ABT158_34990 [Nonomuraea sp. NPDC001636]|uniref:hypothetical protein n=1 Tax=Nonomuraea sp. NPDC001636 TaxID=3154391 RepID=UPI003328577A